MQEQTTTRGAARVRARRASTPQLLVEPYRGSRFGEIWRTLASDPYELLPEARVTAASALALLRKNIYGAARRTLSTRADLLPHFDKLVHPAGICLRGTWRITERSRYTGYFRRGAEGLIIARASDGLGENRLGRLRFLGLAGKLYPTTVPDHEELLETANFVMLENISGSRTRHFVDASLSTDLLPFHPHPGALSKLPIASLAIPAFVLADRALAPTRPMFRQLYPIAELGEPSPEAAVAPQVMRLVAEPRTRRIDTPELREELNMEHHPDGIRYEIHVSDTRSLLVPQGFQKIGEIHFTESVASHAGDHRLHFAHAPYRRGRARP